MILRRRRFRLRGLLLPGGVLAMLATVSCSGCPWWQKSQFGPLVEGGWEKPLPEHTAEFGTHADPASYVGSIYIDAGRRCTATVIGPKAVLTAAHCNTGGGTFTFQLRGQDYKGKCTRYPHYNSANKAGDWSLCRVSRDVTGITYETLSLDSNLVQPDTRVILTGFGFSSFSPPFSMGAATVKKLPSGASDEILTEGATIRDGDSGSAAFVVTPRGGRRVVAVNSRTILSPKKQSALSSLSTGRARAFIDDWLSKSENADVKICGHGTSVVGDCQP